MPNLTRLQLLLATLAGWINRQQAQVINYLVEENRVLKEQLGKKRLRLTDDQRRRQTDDHLVKVGTEVRGLPAGGSLDWDRDSRSGAPRATRMPVISWSGSMRLDSRRVDPTGGREHACAGRHADRLAVEFAEGRRHLPVVELRRAA